jgi:CheY-like chemotaxis protein
VIEDNPDDLSLIQGALEGVGLQHDLIHLSDGEQALDFVRRKGEYAEAAPPHIVLLDLNLPKVDGIEVLQGIRASEHFREVAVIVVSTSRSARDRIRLEELGAEMFWSKPLDLNGFLDLAEIVKAVAVGFNAQNGEK